MGLLGAKLDQALDGAGDVEGAREDEWRDARGWDGELVREAAEEVAQELLGIVLLRRLEEVGVPPDGVNERVRRDDGIAATPAGSQQAVQGGGESLLRGLRLGLYLPRWRRLARHDRRAERHRAGARLSLDEVVEERTEALEVGESLQGCVQVTGVAEILEASSRARRRALADRLDADRLDAYR